MEMDGGLVFGGAGVSGLVVTSNRTPQIGQKRAPAGLLVPQVGQMTMICAPQCEQKIASLVDSVPQFGHRIPLSSSTGDKKRILTIILTENNA
jgi:hypothetical protein